MAKGKNSFEFNIIGDNTSGSVPILKKINNVVINTPVKIPNTPRTPGIGVAQKNGKK